MKDIVYIVAIIAACYGGYYMGEDKCGTPGLLPSSVVLNLDDTSSLNTINRQVLEVDTTMAGSNRVMGITIDKNTVETFKTLLGQIPPDSISGFRVYYAASTTVRPNSTSPTHTITVPLDENGVEFYANAARRVIKTPIYATPNRFVFGRPCPYACDRSFIYTMGRQ